MERQVLTASIDVETFLKGYYLLAELKDFCKQEGIPSSGGKLEVTKRIVQYLKTGEALKPCGNARKQIDSYTLDTKIVENISYSENLRAFFKQEIDASFTFSVPFQRWLKTNVGKTYADAIVAYKDIKKQKKKTTIDKQFEYNTYIRAFFENTTGLTLHDAIRCWNYKKQKLGKHIYEDSDLEVLK